MAQSIWEEKVGQQEPDTASNIVTGVNLSPDTASNIVRGVDLSLDTASNIVTSVDLSPEGNLLRVPGPCVPEQGTGSETLGY